MTTRDKRLTKTINHNTNTTAVMLDREFIGPDGQWWPMQPVDASQDAAAIDAFDNSFAGSQQAQITTLTTERDSLQSELTDAQSKCTIAESQVNQLEQQLDAANEQIATLTAERDALQQQANTLAGQVAQLTQENATALARIAELEAQLNPPRPAEVTPAQIRVWLVMQGVELAQVDALIASIPDPMQREIARIKWEYGVAVIRTDPLVEQLGIALDLTPEQIDAAFVEASQLWSV